MRGVFVVDKEGKVLAAQGGGPEKTVDVVREVVEGLKGGDGPEEGGEVKLGGEAAGEDGAEKVEAGDKAEEEGETKEEEKVAESKDLPVREANGEVKGDGEEEAEKANGEGEKKEE